MSCEQGDQAMSLSDEQIQDLLRVGNPSSEECRLIRIEWDAARNLIAQRGRHNTEIAYRRLVAALEESK